jgi:hypothetical protein
MRGRMSQKLLMGNHRTFQANIDSIIRYGLDIVRDVRPNMDNLKDKAYKSVLLEGLLLRSCALWESFIENEIVFLLNIQPSKLANEMGLSHSTRLNLKLVRALLFSDTYRTLYNIEQSKAFFKRVLPDKYNLFKEIKKDRLNKLNFVYKMRNYLSHYSVFSRKQLFASYKQNYGYRRFLEPGFFLMSKKGKYFENLIHNFKLISLTMERYLKQGGL